MKYLKNYKIFENEKKDLIKNVFKNTTFNLKAKNILVFDPDSSGLNTSIHRFRDITTIECRLSKYSLYNSESLDIFFDLTEKCAKNLNFKDTRNYFVSLEIYNHQSEDIILDFGDCWFLDTKDYDLFLNVLKSIYNYEDPNTMNNFFSKLHGKKVNIKKTSGEFKQWVDHNFRDWNNFYEQMKRGIGQKDKDILYKKRVTE
jgi:hypothetical protein